MSSNEAAAFAALQAIEAGEWDRFLHRLIGAINMRRDTDEYRAHLVAKSSDTSNEGNTEDAAKAERRKRLCGCGHMWGDHSIDDMCSLCDCENITSDEGRNTG